jgi:hypothetical protein
LPHHIRLCGSCTILATISGLNEAYDGDRKVS